MFPRGLVVSWGDLNQLRGGAMRSVCSSFHSRSPAVPPSWITSSSLPPKSSSPLLEHCSHWSFKCSTIRDESGTDCFCTAGRRSTRSLFFFALDSEKNHLLYSFHGQKTQKTSQPAVCFCYWSVFGRRLKERIRFMSSQTASCLEMRKILAFPLLIALLFTKWVLKLKPVDLGVCFTLRGGFNRLFLP